MNENDQKIRNRSVQLIKLFNAFKGKNLEDLPVLSFSKWLNGRIIRTPYDEIELEFEVRPEMVNPTGLIHRGMQCTLIDDIIGMIVNILGYRSFPISIDFHVDYSKKLKVGEKVRVIERTIRKSRNIIHTITKIYDGNFTSTGNSNLLKTHFISEYMKKADEITKEK